MTFKQFKEEIMKSDAIRLVFSIMERDKETRKLVNPVRYCVYDSIDMKRMRKNNDFLSLDQFNDCEVIWVGRNDWCISATLERLI